MPFISSMAWQRAMGMLILVTSCRGYSTPGMAVQLQPHFTRIRASSLGKPFLANPSSQPWLQE